MNLNKDGEGLEDVKGDSKIRTALIQQWIKSGRGD